MSTQPLTSIHVLDLLEGTWEGEGRGYFPGVTSFNYRETLIFTRRDKKTLASEQRTQKLYDGQTEWLQSHWENGFIKILDNGEFQLVDVQSSGRSETLVGTVETVESLIRIHFVSTGPSSDARVLSSVRTFELQGDTLRYEMEMRTTKVNQSSPHLKITLQRIN